MGMNIATCRNTAEVLRTIDEEMAVDALLAEADGEADPTAHPFELTRRTLRPPEPFLPAKD